jgi:hypothetical protein
MFDKKYSLKSRVFKKKEKWIETLENYIKFIISDQRASQLKEKHVLFF